MTSFTPGSGEKDPSDRSSSQSRRIPIEPSFRNSVVVSATTTYLSSPAGCTDDTAGCVSSAAPSVSRDALSSGASTSCTQRLPRPDSSSRVLE